MSKFKSGMKVKILPKLEDYVESEGWGKEMLEWIGTIVTLEDKTWHQGDKKIDCHYIQEFPWYYVPDDCFMVPQVEEEYI